VKSTDKKTNSPLVGFLDKTELFRRETWTQTAKLYWSRARRMA
jgi:hypothetical protein